MYMIMDMGTSNTRLWLYEGGQMRGSKKGNFGAGTSKAKGKAFLFNSLKETIADLLREAGACLCDVDHILTAGMAGSEIGLTDVPHIALPADVYKLADSLVEVKLPEITDIPFVFVPGLKWANGDKLVDIMRGEETEIAGILAADESYADGVFVLPGTHNKVITVKDGSITGFATTMSGELLNNIINNTILVGQVSHDFTVKEADVMRGAAYAGSKGLSAALFHIRVMAKNGKDADALSSFLYGAVLGQDIALIRSFAENGTVYVGGRSNLKTVYGILLGEESAVLLDDETASNAVKNGLLKIETLYNTRKNRAAVLDKIAKEKLVAIIRAPEDETLLDAVGALVRGGVCLAEITFDRSGTVPKTHTAEQIRRLGREFGDKLLVGAGTVTTKEDVMLAFAAGASFIISPNCDPEIIRLTKKLGMVSIPAALTPTEIVQALEWGADFIKLFPADAMGSGYVKAVKAPISDAKLLAVGGVDVNNAAEFMKNGFCGVGIGSGLYNKKLVKAKDWDGITELAAQFVNAVK